MADEYQREPIHRDAMIAEQIPRVWFGRVAVWIHMVAKGITPGAARYDDTVRGRSGRCVSEQGAAHSFVCFQAITGGTLLALESTSTLSPANHGGLHVRSPLCLGLSLAAGTIVVAVLLTAVVLRMHQPPSAQWTDFPIGPASGKSAHVGINTMRSDGMSLKGMIATAYDVPAVRVIGPAWLAETRYSLKAVVGVEEPESLRVLLREELKNRLRLETHVEVRPFDVFVLTGTGAPGLERSEGRKTSIWIRDRDVRLKEATMQQLAHALQSSLGRQVIDETGITGWYNLEFGWEENRVKSVTAVLRERFGLELAPGKRDMDTLIVDHIRRDAALVLLEQIGRMISVAPTGVRQHIAEVLTIR